MMKRIMFVAAVIILMGSSSNAVCIGVSKANLRTGPGTWYDLLWEAYKYTPLIKVGTSLAGDWYAVKDVDGDIGWVKKELVTDKYRCAIVKKERVNVRTGPGTSKSLSSISPAFRYASFSVVEERNKWVRVKDEKGRTGWIHNDFLWIQ